MKLMIVEPISEVPALTKILGPEWSVVASIGELRELARGDMALQAPDFVPLYDLTSLGHKVVGRLKGLARDADEVVLAMHPDRQGEAAAWHLQQALGLHEDFLRVTFSQITPDAVHKSMASPRRIDLRRVDARQASLAIDRLVADTVNAELGELADRPVLAGLAQALALRLVVDRCRAVRRFKPARHYGATLFFQNEACLWSADWSLAPDYASDRTPCFTNRTFAAAVAATRSVFVTDFEEVERRRPAPPPFVASTLQQAAHASLGLDAVQTMAAAQHLYAQGHITYPRTANSNLAANDLATVRDVARGMGFDVADSERQGSAYESAPEDCGAITPTNWWTEEAGDTPERRSLYALIRTRAIASQLADAVYMERTARLRTNERLHGIR